MALTPQLDAQKGNFFAETSEGWRVEYAIDPRMQEIGESLLKEYAPPFGVAVLMNPSTGEIKAAASYRDSGESRLARAGATFLEADARSADHPMASVAKIVAAAAAFEAKLFGTGSSFHCSGSYNTGGEVLRDPVGVRHGDLTMGHAFAVSCNPTFAKIANKVGKERLEDMFDRLQFNRQIPFDLPLLESRAFVGDQKGAVEKAGTGFSGARLSPIHAAMLGATVWNDGLMMRPRLVERILDPAGKEVWRAEPAPLTQAYSKETAGRLKAMMALTVKEGSARKGFKDSRGRLISGTYEVAGKTGSISGDVEGEKYTWFVGFADGSEPLAFAAMIVNEPTWKIKAASFMGRYFQELQAMEARVARRDGAK